MKTKLEAFLSVFEHSVNYIKCGCKLCYNWKHASLIYSTKLYQNDIYDIKVFSVYGNMSESLGELKRVMETLVGGSMFPWQFS